MIPNTQTITFSNILTLSRIFLTPLIVLAILAQEWGVAISFFIIASLTDLLDGFLARLLNQQTVLGTILDPLADKFLIIASYTALILIDSPFFKIPYWFLGIIIAKESALIAGSAYAIYIKKKIVIKPNFLGKLTMFMQVLFIVYIFLCSFFSCISATILNFLLKIIIGLSLSSLVQYAYKIYWELIK